MKVPGFIGAAYTLDSVNVDAQRCVNMYPEVIESGAGKEGQAAYLKTTPGLEKVLEVGEGPIRCLHVDSIGRIFVVSKNKLYFLTARDEWSFTVTPATHTAITTNQTGFNTTTNALTVDSHDYVTGTKVRVTSSNTLPTPLSAGVDYWIIKVSDTVLEFAASLADAVAGTEIDITNAGTGNITITPTATVPVVSSDYDSDIDFPNSTFLAVDHGLYTGLTVKFRTTGLLPGGLTLETDLYVISIDDDSFQLASSLPNASAGTEIVLSAVSETAEWAATQVGRSGLSGGTEVLFESVIGPVKAASLSLNGDGSDSSTVFVDGVNNYFFEDNVTSTTFGPTTQGTIAEATFALGASEDVVISSTDLDLVGLDISIQSFLNTAAGIYRIDFSILPGGAYQIRVRQNSSSNNITTEQFVEAINTGDIAALSGSFLINDPSNIRVKLTATGGNTDNFDSTVGTSLTETFTEETYDNPEFNSVPSATDIVWSDGFFVVNERGTNRFWVSDLNSFNIGALNFASSEGSPDVVLALAILNRYLYVFNETTTEVYANTGNPDFPFERIQGGFVEIGCAAAFSVAKIATSICWLGRSKDGTGVVFMIDGLQPKRISTHAIEQAIRGYANVSGAVAYSYHEAGHSFYVLSFDEATWVYDLSTGMWHERAFLNDGDLERHRAQTHAFHPTLGIHFVGDYSTNELYKFNEFKYTDDGDSIMRLRTTPHMSNSMNYVFCSKFQLDMETGIGLDGGVQGSSPTVMLDWSNDGGHTWSSESFALADVGGGQIGEYKTRVIWRRLGKFRDRIWRVKFTDPNKFVLLDAHVDLEAGAN